MSKARAESVIASERREPSRPKGSRLSSGASEAIYFGADRGEGLWIIVMACHEGRLLRWRSQVQAKIY